jgi:hypothetical protein
MIILWGEKGKGWIISTSFGLSIVLCLDMFGPLDVVNAMVDGKLLRALSIGLQLLSLLRSFIQALSLL